MTSSRKIKDCSNLCKVLSKIDDEKSVDKLLQDLFTSKEMRDAASRLEVARLLDQGISYVEIERQTGASATTIARVSKCLARGSGGYRLALPMLD